MFLTALPVFFGEAPPHHLGMGVSDPKTDSPWRHHGLDTPVFPLGCTKIGKLWPPGFVVRLHEHYGISTPNWHARLSCEETHHGYPLGGEPSSYRARGASDHTPRPEKSKRQTANRQAETLLTYGAPYHILRTPRWIGTHLTNEGPSPDRAEPTNSVGALPNRPCVDAPNQPKRSRLSRRGVMSNLPCAESDFGAFVSPTDETGNGPAQVIRGNMDSAVGEWDPLVSTDDDDIHAGFLQLLARIRGMRYPQSRGAYARLP